MGWSIGYDNNWKRDIGYGVPAFCDHPECTEKIDRGLSYVCGGEPYGGEHGCGLFFCEKHQLMAGDKRENKQLCQRCYRGKNPFSAKPDHPEWIDWKLCHESWSQWRKDNPEEVEQLKVARGQRKTCFGCTNLRHTIMMRAHVAHCALTDAVVPHKYQSDSSENTYWRVPISCPLPDSEVLKSETKAPECDWMTVDVEVVS